MSIKIVVGEPQIPVVKLKASAGSCFRHWISGKTEGINETKVAYSACIKEVDKDKMNEIAESWAWSEWLEKDEPKDFSEYLMEQIGE